MDVGLRQGRALSPLLFIAVVEVISEYEGHSVVADCEADLQERLVEWKEMFDRHRLRVSLEKTETLWVGQQTQI